MLICDVGISKQVVLGVEGGGTKTEWLQLDQTGLHGGRLPAANLRLLSDSQLEEILRVLPANPTHVGVFLAGCATAADQRRLDALVEKVWPNAQRRTGSDRDSGFAAAFGERNGITVIAGTGSAVTGRLNGQIEKAGGWGHVLGDIGGGYQLAVQGFRRTLYNYDLDQQITPLATGILRALGLNRLDELVQWVMHADKMSVAQLAPVVFEAARNGDLQMQAAIEDSARRLAEYTQAVAKRLRFDAPQVSVMGGLFMHHPEYVDYFKTALRSLLPGTKVDLCRKSGAEGALYLAERPISQASGIPVLEPDPELAGAATEQPNPRSSNLDWLSTRELVDLFISEESKVQEALDACRNKLTAAVDLIAAALQGGGRLFYAGAGTSGRLGVLDASEIPPTFGTSPELVQGIIAGGAPALFRAAEGAEDQRELGALSIVQRGVRTGDVVCGITASGRTPFVLGALAKAAQLGARTILLSCNPDRSKTGPSWDLAIDLPTGPEILTGSTRLKAGTATKVALNIFSTATMIRLGKVRGNLMSNLNVSNAKLRDRAIRLVSAARHCTYEQARTLLTEYAWDVRRALEQG